jgi:hypothetical protein
MKTIALLLTAMMVFSLIICVDARNNLKYSEVVNISAEEFAESINNNITALLNDLKIANETHDYETIVKCADLIEQNRTLAMDMVDAFNWADSNEKADVLCLSVRYGPYVAVETTYWSEIRDARRRVKEKEEELWEKQRQEVLAELDNNTSPENRIPNNGFGSYLFNGQDKVRVTIKKGTDIIHMMAIEELPTDSGYTKDLEQYTITSTGKKIKGYIDYTLDGFVVIMQPKVSSLTKREFMDILDTFQRG